MAILELFGADVEWGSNRSNRSRWRRRTSGSTSATPMEQLAILACSRHVTICCWQQHQHHTGSSCTSNCSSFLCEPFIEAILDWAEGMTRSLLPGATGNSFDQGFNHRNPREFESQKPGSRNCAYPHCLWDLLRLPRFFGTEKTGLRMFKVKRCMVTWQRFFNAGIHGALRCAHMVRAKTLWPLGLKFDPQPRRMRSLFPQLRFRCWNITEITSKNWGS